MKYFLAGGALLVSGAVSESFFQYPLHDTAGAPLNHGIVAGITSNPHQVANMKYDYIIAGGGLTGLTIAAKLLQSNKMKNSTVLVIESGFSSSEYGPVIDDLNTYGEIFGTSVDHAYTTSPQDVNHRVEIVRSGNGLGGSTLINGGTWTRPHKAQLDSWRDVFGVEKWGWKDLEPFMNEIEDPQVTDKLMLGSQHNFSKSCHNQNGNTGAVKVGIRNTNQTWSPMIPALMKRVREVTAAPSRKDLCCGDPQGISMVLNTLNHTQVRMDAARSWLDPILQNSTTKNRITVLTGQLVGKVLLEKIPEATVDSQYKATGVEFGTHTSVDSRFNVTANHEVLLAAGSAVSPLILQYSGIGPKKALEEAGVKQKLELPVGLNLQDQTTTSVVSNSTKEGAGQGQAAYFATFKEVFGSHSDTFEAMLKDNKTLQKWADDTVAGGGFHDERALFDQYVNYRGWLLGNQSVPYAELFFDTDGRIHCDLWNLLPFTRGYVKILDKDPYLRRFDYNPRFFQNELDIFGQAAASKLARQLSREGSMKPYFHKELNPGNLLGDNATLNEWAQYVKQNFRSNYHGVGTCSMMKKELGGVVDNKAKVYGVERLRVVDGSIPPTQVSSHVMTIFYGMAAKIAKAIEDDYNSKLPLASEL